MGDNDGTISNSYWDIQASGQTVGVGSGSANGVTGLTTTKRTIYNLNGNIVSSGSHIYNGSANLSAGAILRSTAGPIITNDAVIAGNNSLTLSGSAGITINGAVNSDNTLTVESGGNITLNNTITSKAANGNASVAAAGGDFINSFIGLIKDGNNYSVTLNTERQN